MPRGVQIDNEAMFHRVLAHIPLEGRAPTKSKHSTKDERVRATWVSRHVTESTPWGQAIEKAFAEMGITREAKGCSWSLPTRLPSLPSAKPLITLGDVLEITSNWPTVFAPLVGSRAVVRWCAECDDAQAMDAELVVLEADGFTPTTHTLAVSTHPNPRVGFVACPNGWNIVDHLEPVVTWVRPRTRMDDWNDVAAVLRRAVGGTPEMEHLGACLERLKPQ